MEQLLSYLNSKNRLEPELENALSEVFIRSEIETQKNDFLLEPHQYCQKLYFLAEGTVRNFYYDKGKDVSSWFYNENQFFTSWYSFINQVPSFEYIEALETCRIFSIDYYQYQKLLKEFPAFERIGRIIVEEQLAFIDYYSKGYMFMSAKEKYDLLISYFPNITQKVNLGHIASFLGISQETLSRIRKKK